MVDLPDLPKIKKQTEYVPPPPPEMEVRTMRTDLESVSASGGISLQAEEVASLLAAEEKKSSVAPRSSGVLSLIAIGVVVLVAAIVVGFLFFYIFSGSLPNISFLLGGGEPQTEDGVEEDYQPLPNAYPTFKYESYLKLEAQDIVPVVLPREGASSVAELKTFRQGLLNALSAVRGRNAFVEVLPQDSDELPYSWAEFLKLNDVALLNENFWLDVFEPNFNLFIYRDGRGAWPGYVLKLQQDEAVTVNQDSVAAIEKQSQEIAKLFIDPPQGGRTFEEGSVLGTLTRQKPYDNPTGAMFVYAWYGGKYLVLSTSFDGMGAVITLLQQR
ncbi:MAG: hypothetical protein KGZ30_02830 [Anaplasmataceae bacterium]|nr:hypothetical protein [Anaplasmataceae bacterium]